MIHETPEPISIINIHRLASGLLFQLFVKRGQLKKKVTIIRDCGGTPKRSSPDDKVFLFVSGTYDIVMFECSFRLEELNFKNIFKTKKLTNKSDTGCRP